MSLEVRKASVSTEELLKDSELSYLKELSSSANPRLDIVAVHGLRIPTSCKPLKDPKSFGARTWIAGAAGEEKLWLKDFLPDDVHDARIFLFGYNSNVGLDTSIAGTSGAADDLLAKLRDHRRASPERPLLVLCHSLGGIVVKQAIAKARSSPKYQELFYSIRAVAFFATPHRGGLAAAEGRAAAGALRRLTGNVRSSIMEALLPDSFYSFDIHQAFLDSLERIRVCTFYEMRKMPGVPALVVSRNSAVLGLPYPDENVVPLPESNHSSICKFASRSQNYELVVEALADLVEWATSGPYVKSRQSFSASSGMSDEFSSEATLYSSRSKSFSSPQPLETPPSTEDTLPIEWETSIKLSIKDPENKKGPFYLLPSIAGRDFVGRKTVLDQIKVLFTDLNVGQPSNVALYGLGGVGKTQIALQILDWYKSTFPDRSIFWVQARSADLIRQSLTEIGVRCGLFESSSFGQPLDSVRQFLRDPTNGRWLIIVDNADSINPFLDSAGHLDPDHQYKLSIRVMLAHYVPRVSHGQTLYTTRSKAVGEKLSNAGHVIELGPMEDTDSRELLRSQMRNSSQSVKSPLSHRTEIPRKEVPSDARLESLCDHLNHIPLALSQAAAFMRQQNVTVGEYLNLIEQDKSRLTHVLEHDFMTMSSDDRWSKAVATTWNITFSEIESSVPEAAELLSFMAFLSPQSIPKFLLQAVIPDEWSLTATALGTLQSYALVNAGTEVGTFNMHLLVQLAVRRRLESAGSITKWIGKVLETLSEQFPTGGYDVLPTCAALLPHALQALDHSRHADTLPVTAIAELQAKMGKYYHQQWLFPQALEATEQALATVGNEKDIPKAFALDVKRTQIWVFKSMGRYDEAEILAKEVWLERQHLLGAKHVDTLNDHKTLSLAYQEQGKLDKAAQAARSALKSLQKTQPDDDPNLLDMKRRLGSVLHRLGEDDEAETLLREAVDGATRQFGPDDVATLKYQWNLGRVLHSQGKYAEAETLNWKTLKAQRRILGEEHVDPLQTLYLITGDLRAQGKFDAALRYARQVYDAALGRLGPENPYTWYSTSSLAACLVASATAATATATDRGQLTEAAALYERVLASRQNKLRADHPETLGSRTDVATVQRLRGDPAGAAAMERETLKKLGAVLGDEHPLALASREQLARALWDQRAAKPKVGKEGVEQARKALRYREKRSGWRHPDTRRVAELLIEMVADGKEKDRVRRKLAEGEQKS